MNPGEYVIINIKLKEEYLPTLIVDQLKSIRNLRN